MRFRDVKENKRLEKFANSPLMKNVDTSKTITNEMMKDLDRPLFITAKQDTMNMNEVSVDDVK